MELVLGQFRPLETTNYPLGLHKCQMDDVLASQGEKLHPQNITLPFYEHVFFEEP